MLLACTKEAPEVQIRDGGVVIDMPWNDADRLFEHFRRRGLPGTVNLDPTTREATLTLWDQGDIAAARRVLDEWPG